MHELPTGSSLQVQADKLYQESALPGVSRSFAFTIPQLPEALRTTVINAYLLCRVADTIEDHAFAPEGKQALFEQFLEGVRTLDTDDRLPGQLLRRLSAETPPAERELVRNLPRVLRVTGSLPDNHRRVIWRCVNILGGGMARFDELKSPTGLHDTLLFDEYCYHVAGVVGEMLTQLFCDYSPALAQRRSQLMRLAVAFGQGLQMTNILKDVWEDRQRGCCWLPRDLFARHGCALASADDWASDAAFQAGMNEMVALAHGQLQAALQYTLLIPAEHNGIRRFCSWAIGMALLTLKRIHRHRGFTGQHQVKIPRSQVARVIAVSNLAVKRDWTLRLGFWAASRGLPAPPPAADRPAQGSPQTGSTGP